MRRSIVAAAFLALALAGCGTSEDSAGASADTQQSGGTAEGTAKDDKASDTTRVGEPLTVKAQSGATAEVTILKVTITKKSKGEFAENPVNGQYVVVDVRIKVTGDKFSVNPLYVRYQAKDDKVFESIDGNALTSGYEPQLESGDIPAGQTSRGLVVFDTPIGAGKQIQLTDELGSPIAFWQL